MANHNKDFLSGWITQILEMFEGRNVGSELPRKYANAYKIPKLIFFGPSGDNDH